MNMTTRAVLFVTSLTLLVSGCVQANTGGNAAADAAKAAETKAADAAANVTAIKALEERFVAAFKAKDLKAVMASYVPDQSLVVFDVLPPRQVVGPERYAKNFEEIFTLVPGPLDVTISDLAVTADAGDIAFAHSIQRIAGATKDGGKIDFTVRVTDTFQKVNGQWLIAHEHVSVPVDLATGKGDMESKP